MVPQAATKLRFRIYCASFGVVVVLVVISAFAYERIVEIDINSGRLLHRERIGPLIIAENVEGTDFSALVADDEGVHRPGRWRIVLSASLLDPISPHYRYHSIPNDLRLFLMACEIEGVSFEMRRQHAALLLEILRRDQPRVLRTTIDEFLRSRGMW